MTESATSPFSSQPVSEVRRDPGHESWVVRTEALLFNFEEAAPEHVSPALGFVIMAADFLWSQHRRQADFAKLDTFAFMESCRPLLTSEDALRAFTTTLCAFYEFLGARGLIDRVALDEILGELRRLIEPVAEGST